MKSWVHSYTVVSWEKGFYCIPVLIFTFLVNWKKRKPLYMVDYLNGWNFLCILVIICDEISCWAILPLNGDTCVVELLRSVCRFGSIVVKERPTFSHTMWLLIHLKICCKSLQEHSATYFRVLWKIINSFEQTGVFIVENIYTDGWYVHMYALVVEVIFLLISMHKIISILINNNWLNNPIGLE